jgi:HK97 family phage portal protein
MRTFGTAGTVYQIVSLLASSVASPDWRLYRKPVADGRVRYTTGDQGSDQRTEVVRHAALSLWRRPNNFYTRHELVETSQQHMELVGECFWVLEYGPANFPLAMWPVRPDRMIPVPSSANFLDGWVYIGPSGEKVPLQVNEVIQTKFPNPMDPYRGLGPVQSVLVDIDAMKYSTEWNRNFFINSAEPGGIIQVPEKLSDTEFNELSHRWRESHQGVARAHRVAILENATWVDRHLSMRDMEFTQLRGVSRDVIREAWGIHKSMLGNADDVNRANAQTAEEVFGRWKIVPRLERMKLTLNERFLPLFGATGEGVEFDYVNPLPDDREADNAELTAKANAAATLVAAGFNEDDVCEVVGLPPMRISKPPVVPEPDVVDTEGEPAEQDDGSQFDNRVISTLRGLWQETGPAPRTNGHKVSV